MGPRILLSTSSFFPDTALAFQMAGACGYDGVEVMVSYDRQSQSADAVAALAADHGVPVAAVHVPCLVLSSHVWGWNPELKLRRTVEMAAQLEADVVVVHPPFRWQRAQERTFRQAVLELSDAVEGPQITVENMYRVETMGRRVDPWLWSEEEALLGFPALTLDTSHAGAARQDVVELYGTLADRVHHLHLSDSTSTRGDEHLPPGMGTLDLEGLAKVMVDDGFEGHVVLEVGIGRLPVGSRRETTLRCAEWARHAFAP